MGPGLSGTFWLNDASVWRCLNTILGTPSAPDGAQVIATLALSARGLGLSVSLVSKQPGSAEKWWERQGWLCLRGPSCLIPLSCRGRTGAQPNRDTAGSRQPPDNWRRGSCLTWCGPEGVVDPAWTSGIGCSHRPSRATRIDCQPFRVLLCRRLHFTFPPVSPHLPMWPPT